MPLGRLNAPSVKKRLAGLACCLVAVLVAMPVFAEGVVYRYVDDNGVTNFSETKQNIPEHYLPRVQALDAATLQPIREIPAQAIAPQPIESAPAPAPVSPAAPAPPSHPSMLDAWIEKFSALTIPLPSRFQLGVGLTALALIVGMTLGARVSSNLLVKAALRASIMLIAGGSVYVAYFSGYNERVTTLTKEQPHQTTTGKALIEDLKGKASQATQSALTPVKGFVGKAVESTVGDVRKTVNDANQSNHELEQRLQQIEPSSPQAAGTP